MKLPLPLVLYASSAGLLGWAGWCIYDSRDLWLEETARAATIRGRDTAIAKLAQGRSTVPTSSGWKYGATSWWEQFLAINLIGKVDVPPPAGRAGDDEAEAPIPPPTPLEDIFEMVVCYHDDAGDGTADKSHVVIRYKPEAQVQPPQWWLDENSSITQAPGTPHWTAARKVTTVNRFADKLAQAKARRDAIKGHNGTAPATLAGREVLQKLYVTHAGDPRREAKLWPPYEHIQLTKVDVSGEAAWFLRDGNEEPEELLKTSADIPQDVFRAVRQLQNREVDASREPKVKPGNQWLDVENTTRVGNTFHIGRNDERLFRDPKGLFGSVHFDTYVSKYSDARGLIIRNIDKQLAKTFGLQSGEVLLTVNGRQVRSQAQAANLAKRSYERGVRTFTTTWWSNGQEIERVYQAPDR